MSNCVRIHKSPAFPVYDLTDSILESALFSVSGPCTFIFALYRVERERKRHADVPRVRIGIPGHYGNGIITRPTVTLGSEYIIGKNGCGKAIVE